MQIYLDDRRTPLEGDWTIVRSYYDFIFLIEQSFDKIKLVSFDYRLNIETSLEKTGLDCAKYLVDYCIKNNKHLPRTLVHDSEIFGIEQIVHCINEYLLFDSKFPDCRWNYVENF
jgi:hypothetical protein